jgi:hypothetical protein
LFNRDIAFTRIQPRPWLQDSRWSLSSSELFRDGRPLPSNTMRKVEKVALRRRVGN